MNVRYKCLNCGNRIKILDADIEEDYDCPACETTLLAE
jgi:DNA-directed RNA polymerase subunit RPC12/RpoP